MTGTGLVLRANEVEKGAGPESTPTVSASWMTRIEEHPAWDVVSQLRVKMRVGVRLNRFRVRDLVGLQKGQIFESVTPSTEDVPLMVGQVQLGWSEFEVQEQRMALRLTRLG